MIKIPGVTKIPKGLKIVNVQNRYVEAIRSDGMRVFFDRSDDEASIFLNHLRIHASPVNLIHGLAVVRGAQIAQNYSRRHPHESIDPKEFDLNKILQVRNIPSEHLEGNLKGLIQNPQ